MCVACVCVQDFQDYLEAFVRTNPSRFNLPGLLARRMYHGDHEWAPLQDVIEKDPKMYVGPISLSTLCSEEEEEAEEKGCGTLIWTYRYAVWHFLFDSGTKNACTPVEPTRNCWMPLLAPWVHSNHHNMMRAIPLALGMTSRSR